MAKRKYFDYVPVSVSFSEKLSIIAEESPFHWEEIKIHKWGLCFKSQFKVWYQGKPKCAITTEIKKKSVEELEAAILKYLK